MSLVYFFLHSRSATPPIGNCFQFPANKPNSVVIVHPLNDKPTNDFTVDMKVKFTKKTSQPFFLAAFKGSGGAGGKGQGAKC